MKITYAQIKKREKIFRITISTIFFLVSFIVMLAVIKFVSSI